jgi:hypothetical protein
MNQKCELVKWGKHSLQCRHSHSTLGLMGDLERTGRKRMSGNKALDSYSEGTPSILGQNTSLPNEIFMAFLSPSTLILL